MKFELLKSGKTKCETTILISRWQMHGGSSYEDFRLNLASCLLFLLRTATSHFGFTLRASVVSVCAEVAPISSIPGAVQHSRWIPSANRVWANRGHRFATDLVAAPAPAHSRSTRPRFPRSGSKSRTACRQRSVAAFRLRSAPHRFQTGFDPEIGRKICGPCAAAAPILQCAQQSLTCMFGKRSNTRKPKSGFRRCFQHAKR